MDLYNQFLENPNNRGDFLTLEEELSTSEKWQDLLTLYDSYVGTHPEDEKNYLFKKVILLDEYLEDSKKAIDVLVDIISREDFNFTHLKYLEALCESTKELEQLAQAYKFMLPKLEDQELELMLNYKTALLLQRCFKIKPIISELCRRS